MKWGIAIILVLCFVHVQSRKFKLFTPGYEYRYRYIGQALSCIPDVDASQVSAIALKGIVRIQAMPNAVAIVKFEHLKSATINAELRTVDMEKIPYRFEDINSPAEILSPFVVKYDRGLISEFESNSKESEYITNVKRGIMEMLQLRLDEYYVVNSEKPTPYSSRPYQSYDSEKKQQAYSKLGWNPSNYASSVIDDTESYDVMEDGLAGVCKTTYIVESNPWPGNPDYEVVNVTKLRDFDDCEDESVWAVSSHPTNNCTDCDAEDEDPVDSMKVCEYDIRVDSDKVVIERIDSRSETVYAPLTTNADEIHTNHSKSLILISVNPISTPLPRPMNPKTYESLQYDYPELDEGKEPTIEELHNRPASFMPLDGKQYADRARVLINEITQEIDRNSQEPMIKTPSKVHELGRALRTLSAPALSRILQESVAGQPRQEYGSGSEKDVDHIKRQVTIDSMLLCGSLPCSAVLLSKIESREIYDGEAAHILTVLPLNIRRPTAPLIEKVLRLCESDVIKKGTQLQKSCWLSAASLIDQSCGSNETTVPVSPGLDSYCTDEQELKYVQVIGKQLRKAEKAEQRLLFVHALEVTGSDEMVEILRPIVQGEVQVSERVRSKAVYALRRAANESPTVAQEIANLVAPIFFDDSETTVMRSAALITLTSSSPKPHLMERIASVTWDEDDNQLVGLISTLLDSYGNTTHPCYANAAAHAGHAQALVDDDVEDDDMGIQDSQMHFTDSVDDDYNLASILKAYNVANNQTVIPRTFFLKLERLIAGYSQTPFKVQLQAQGIESVINRLLGPKGAFSKLSLEEIFRSSYENEAPKNYRDLFNKLKIDPRADEPLKIAVYLQTMTTQHSMYYLDAQKILNILESGSSWPAISSLFGSGLKISTQKIFDFGYVRYQLPSCLGLPIVVKFESPAILKIKGKISINVADKYNYSPIKVPIPKKINVHMDIKPTLSVNLITTMGTVGPMKKVYAAAGVISKLYITAPIETDVKIDIENAKVSTVVKYSKQQKPTSGRQMLFYYEVNPFTAVLNYATFDPQLSTLKRITSKDKLDEYEIPVGLHVLGMGVLKVKSDQFWQDKGSFWSYFIEDNDPLLLATSFWATPDFKYRQYALTVDAETARNTEVSMAVDVDYIPSKIQALLRQGQTNARGGLPFLLGWSKIPWQCNSEKVTFHPTYAEKDSRSRSSSDYYDEKKSRPSNDDDDDDDDDDNYAGYQERRTKRSLYQNISYGIDEDYYGKERSRPRQYSSYGSQPFRSTIDDRDDDDDNDDDDDDDNDDTPWVPIRPSSDYPDSKSAQGRSSIHSIPINTDTATSIIKVKVDMAVKGRVTRSMKSILTLIRDKSANADAMKLDVSVKNPPFTPNDKLEICAAGRMKYPVLPCDYVNALNPDKVNSIISKLAISFGQSCSDDAGKIEMQTVFSKTKDQKEYEREGKAWFFKQCQEDYKEGKKMSSACVDAVEAVGELKKMELDIQYKNLPSAVYNMTYKLENLANYIYYLYMTKNVVDIQNEPNHLKIKSYFDDSDPTIDVKVLKPRSNIYYDNVYTDEISEYLQPINARVSFWRSTLDDITGGYAPPTCKLMGSYIENFDNETYKVPIGNCRQLLTKDCSPSDLFSVLVKKLSTGHGKELEVHLLHHKIVARPSGPLHSGKFEIIVDGEKQVIQSNVVRFVKSMGVGGEYKVLAAIVVIGDLLHIRAPYHAFRTKFDGENCKIEVSNMYRGDLCGMCSEFDGSTDETLVGPGKCEYADPKDFAYSYTLPDSQCSAPTPSDRKICPDTGSYKAVGYRQHMASRKSSYDDYDDSIKMRYSKSTLTGDKDDDDVADEVDVFTNTVYRNKVVYRFGKSCYSISSVKECQASYYPTKMESRPVGFTCLNEHTPLGRKLKDARDSRRLQELASYKIDFTDTVEEPIYCMGG